MKPFKNAQFSVSERRVIRLIPLCLIPRVWYLRRMIPKKLVPFYGNLCREDIRPHKKNQGKSTILFKRPKYRTLVYQTLGYRTLRDQTSLNPNGARNEYRDRVFWRSIIYVYTYREIAGSYIIIILNLRGVN